MRSVIANGMATGFVVPVLFPLLSNRWGSTNCSRHVKFRTYVPVPSRVQGVATKSKLKGAKGGSGKREKKNTTSQGLLKALEKYEPVIGVEVHVQLNTKTKAYCKCSTKPVRTPNVNICPVCTGLPGALPVVNRRVVELAAKAGMALGCKISLTSAYDRKNYYYADTPKNYQITQDRYPIALAGFIELVSSGKRIGITRLHMEEDSAKMSHEGAGASGRITDSTHSLIDFNRSGVPLIEVVSEPDLRSGAETAEYGQELQRILRYVGTSDCNMQDGSLRFDVNVSIRPKGTEQFGNKVELKNLNSFSAAQKCVDFEIERQASLIDAGNTVVVETRTWDEKAQETRTLRVKEGAADYRYFPEPDLPPLSLKPEMLEEWRRSLPELPAGKRQRYQEEYGLSNYDAFVLSDDMDVAKYFDETIEAGGNPKLAANWIMGDISKVLNSEKMGIRLSKLSAQHLADMIKMIEGGVINGKVGKDLIPELVLSGGNPNEIVEQRYVIVSFAFVFTTPLCHVFLTFFTHSLLFVGQGSKVDFRRGRDSGNGGESNRRQSEGACSLQRCKLSTFTVAHQHINVDHLTTST